MKRSIINPLSVALNMDWLKRQFWEIESKRKSQIVKDIC